MTGPIAFFYECVAVQDGMTNPDLLRSERYFFQRVREVPRGFAGLDSFFFDIASSSGLGVVKM